MAFAEEMIPQLRSLAKKLVDFEMYSDLSAVADLLAAFKSGKWPGLSLDDQEFYLEKMQGTFHVRGMGDSPAGYEPEYRFILERVDRELRGLRKKKNA
jgi:hypothetical protein